MKKIWFVLPAFACVLVLVFVFVHIFCNRYPVRYKNEVVMYANEFGVEPSLAMAVCYAESSFKADAVSGAGAVGVMQILPSTGAFVAEQLGMAEYNLFDAKTNIRFGCFYLSYLFSKFESEVEVFCAYNAGEARVGEWKRSGSVDLENIPFPETKNYVKKVLKLKKYYQKKL